MRKADSEYYAGRLTAARKAAAQAKNKVAKAAHEKMAEYYATRLNGDGPKGPSNTPEA
jgi:hypothetical protein